MRPSRAFTAALVLLALASPLRAADLDAEARLLRAFRAAFPPRGSAGTPVAPAVRCLTPLVAEYHAHRDHLSAEAVREIDACLAPPPRRGLDSHVSPSGLFELLFTTTGPDSVPSADTDPANGVPDWIEACAEAADESWAVEITGVGFTAPDLPPDGTYDIHFENLGGGFYGYTEISGGTTFIAIHSTFGGVGWPGPNDDPDGTPIGRARATIAHEFKHASQYTGSAWSEGYWIELDAMWVEDVVFDQVNDWHNWVGFGSLSQLDEPATRLDNGGEGSYEDCLWQHHLAQEYGNGLIVDVWNRRATDPGEDMKDSYAGAMALHATSWATAWPAFYDWCWFTGSRAEPPFGFDDAPDLYRMRLLEPAVTSFPFDSGPQAVDRLAAHPRRFQDSALPGFPRVRFDGADGHDAFTLSVIAEETDGAFTITHPPLDAARNADYVVPTPWSDLQYVGVIVTNHAPHGVTASYELQVTDLAVGTGVASGSPPSGDRLRLEASPNPTGGSVRLAWTAPWTGRARIRVLDVAGRTVRRLVDTEVDAGTGEARWDGRDDAGRRVPAGVYWARIDIGATSAARRLTVVR